MRALGFLLVFVGVIWLAGDVVLRARRDEQERREVFERMRDRGGRTA